MTSADQIAIIGDRLFTDVMLANLMGSWSVWVKDGVVETRNQVGSWFESAPLVNAESLIVL